MDNKIIKPLVGEIRNILDTARRNIVKLQQFYRLRLNEENYEK